jgi:hypothetical protein
MYAQWRSIFRWRPVVCRELMRRGTDGIRRSPDQTSELNHPEFIRVSYAGAYLYSSILYDPATTFRTTDPYPLLLAV